MGKENGVRGGTRRRRGMSMAGVPPMGGFRGKRRVYREVVEEGYRRRARRGEVWKGEKEREDEIESEGNEERFIV